MTTQLSSHFTLEEATLSSIGARNGLDNSVKPDEIDMMAALVNTAAKLEVVRAILNQPIHIDSWYRCPELNAAVGSKPTSQHIKGEAVDFICPAFGSPLQICKTLVAHADLVRFDQLILEHTWVHISWFAIPGVKQRNQVLSLLSSGGYATGLTDVNGNSL